jgi:hypothetical protein
VTRPEVKGEGGRCWMDEKVDQEGGRKVVEQQEGEGDDRVATRARGSHALGASPAWYNVMWKVTMVVWREVWMGWRRTHDWWSV